MKTVKKCFTIDECSLKSNNPYDYFLRGRGVKKAKIMFIQDSPSDLEMRKEKQCSGKSFNHFTSSLEKRDIDINNTYWTSVVKCPAVLDNKGVSTLTYKDCNVCLDLLHTEIEVIDPDIVVPLGNMALKATLGYVGVTKHRGNAQEVELDGRKRIILPMIHPRQALKKPGYQTYIFKDMDTLADLAEYGMNEVTSVNYLVLNTKEKAIKEIKRLNKEAEWLSFDLETTGKNPYLPGMKIICISLTDKDHYGAVIPLFHHESPITGSDRLEVIAELKKLLENTKIKKVAHNGKFDIEWLEAQLKIKVKNFCFDTMLAHYLAVSEETGTQGLKKQAWEFTDMGGYDNDLDTFKNTLPEAQRGNYDNIPWEILSKYAVADVDCCIRLKNIYHPMIYKNKKWAVLMDEFLMPGSYALKDVEKAGMLMSTDIKERYEKTYTDELTRIKEALSSYPEVLEIERDRAEKFAKREALKKIPKKDRTPEEQKMFEDYGKEKYKNPTFNWSSSSQLKELLFDKLGLTTTVRTNKGEYSTNDEALTEMAEQHEIPRLMMEYRKINTLTNMFILKLPNMCDDTGLIHCSFNLAGTQTGRLSSTDPNMQQIPRKAEKCDLFQYHNEPKALFISRFGKDGCILNADYSQLEIRVAGMISHDKKLQQVYESGQDLHKATASLVWNIPVEEVTKDLRTSAKSVNFGIIYGKSGITFAKDLYYDETGENPNKTSDWDKAKAEGLKLVDDYLNTFKGLKKWIEDTKEFAIKNGYVETMFGRRRRLPDLYSNVESIRSGALRQSINAPIQGTGTDMTLGSIIRIQKFIKKNKLKSRMICTVHDSIVFDVYIPELSYLAENIKYIMEHIHKEYFDTKVPFVSELELGSSYGSTFDVELEEVQKIDSTDKFNDWMHTMKIGKYTKEIDQLQKKNLTEDDCINWMIKHDRPIEELRAVIKEKYKLVE